MATLLRTLTLKSKMGFGKYPNETVDFVIKQKRIAYLRWVYFNMSKINFNDEVLGLLRITPKFQIKKPGKNPEQFDSLESIDRTQRMKSPYGSIESKALLRGGQQRRERYRNNKARDAWRNQGH